ncbi:chemotaxis protein CheD [Terribacillus saccharophilus]|uniref:Probable chemoreceptor glutamine deamidase CheD n=1 Tax=Terribacillus saccharophilus TaxID=361277 RepID=A0A075LKB6_9BACI|nr:chemotaxis protein CheD [Terribacillus goriensis]AIF66397.1 chemotaxis protein CheD [Terribacillus goriensis]
MTEAEILHVGIADAKIATYPEHLRTAGLGSCVGVVVYDKQKKIAGMAHVMLPDSNMAKQTQMNRNKYADTALDDLIANLLRRGASKSRFKAKLAGGAQMFSFMSSDEKMRIGPRNIEAVEQKLREYRIPIESKDVGGSNGRTIEFNTNTCGLKIKTVSKEEAII